MTRFSLDKLLHPTSVAVVGASPREETVGFRVVRNLRRLGFPRTIFPVNPDHPELAGGPGSGAAVINASGYAAGGPEGGALQARLRATAIAHGIALCGPNNTGV